MINILIFHGLPWSRRVTGAQRGHSYIGEFPYLVTYQSCCINAARMKTFFLYSTLQACIIKMFKRTNPKKSHMSRKIFLILLNKKILNTKNDYI